MMRIWGKAALAAVVGIGILAGAPARAETLADALISAYRNSQLLEQNRALLRVADEDVAVAVSALRPIIDFGARSVYSYDQRRVGTPDRLTASLVLSAEMTLYDFGASPLGVAAAKELVLATRQSLVGVEHRVLLNAVQAYTDIRLQEDTVVLRQSNVRVIERELRAARDRFELGEITRTDVAFAEARIAAARNNLTAAEGDLAVARESYNLAVGRYPGRLSVPPRAPQTARSLPEAKSIARRTHYAIRQLQHEVVAADLNVARADARMMPRLTARAEYGLEEGGKGSGTISLGLSQRLYQGGALSAGYRQAIARRDATRSLLHLRTAEVEQAVGEAWARLSVAIASIDASERQIRAARTAFENVSQEAQLGGRTTLDVLNAEQELLDAQARLLAAQTASYNANYGVLASMGLLTVEHLGLGIPTYDVTEYYNSVSNAPTSSPQGTKLDRVLKRMGN